jgi:hypothetical protein
VAKIAAALIAALNPSMNVSDNHPELDWFRLRLAQLGYGVTGKPVELLEAIS